MRRAALALAVVALAALGLYVLLRDEPAEAPPPQPAAPLPADAAAPAPPEPPPDASEPAPPPGPVTFQDGFCSEAGAESFQARYSLARLVLTELRRRRASDGGEAAQPDTQLLVELAHEAVPADVADHARQLAARLPDSPWPQVALAIAARALDQPDEQLAALRRARQLLPRDPALGLAVAIATTDTADLDEAIEGLTVYLAADPEPGVSRLRARLEVQRDIQRGYQRETRNGITVLWPGEVLKPTQADEIAVAVDRGLDDAAAFSGSARRKRLTVVVYPTRSELLAVTCARAWANGVYDGTLRVVAPQAGATFDWKALRHETLHAQLSPLAPLAPRWFHEGAAQSFAQQLIPRRQWQQMVRSRVWVPFSSLDGTFQIFGSNDDASLAYAQSYALVELMRELNGDRAIATALAAFQAGADTPTALARACGRTEVTGADLLAFLERRLAQR